MKTKILFFYHHHESYGHTSRLEKLLHSIKPLNFNITIISGGRPSLVERSKLEKFGELIHLDEVQVSNNYNLINYTEELKQNRIDKIKEIITNIKPSILCLEFFPFGRHMLSDEFLSAIETVKKYSPDAKIISSMRDLLGQELTQNKKSKISLYLSLFDYILIHGDKNLFPFDFKNIDNKLIYTGYFSSTPVKQGPQSYDILFTFGGGRDFGLYEKTIFFVANSFPHKNIKVITGEFSNVHNYQDLKNVSFIRSTTKMKEEMSCASIVISMCGYNSFSELLELEKKTIFIPRPYDREQGLRALFAKKIPYMRTLGLTDSLTGNIIECINQLDPQKIEKRKVPFYFNGLNNCKNFFMKISTEAKV
ncbi:MAG: glycosyltransferase [Bacteriovoracaceae bacterium]